MKTIFIASSLLVGCSFAFPFRNDFPLIPKKSKQVEGAAQILCGQKAFECAKLATVEPDDSQECSTDNFYVSASSEYKCFADATECHQYDFFKARMYDVLGSNLPVIPTTECDADANCKDVCIQASQVVNTLNKVMNPAECTTKIAECNAKSNLLAFEEVGRNDACEMVNAWSETTREATYACLLSPEVHEPCKYSQEYQENALKLQGDGELIGIFDDDSCEQHARDCVAECKSRRQYIEENVLIPDLLSPLEISVSAEFQNQYTEECREQVLSCTTDTSSFQTLFSTDGQVCEAVNMLEWSSNIFTLECLGSPETQNACSNTDFYRELHLYTSYSAKIRNVELNCPEVDDPSCREQCIRIVKARNILKKLVRSAAFEADEVSCGQKSLECLRLMNSIQVVGTSECKIYENFENFGRYKTIQCYVDNTQCHQFGSFKARMRELLFPPCTNGEKDKCHETCKKHDVLVEKSTKILNASCEAKVNGCFGKSENAKYEELTSKSPSLCARVSAFLSTKREATIQCLYEPEVFNECRMSPVFEAAVLDAVNDASNLDDGRCDTSSCADDCNYYARSISFAQQGFTSEFLQSTAVAAEIAESYTAECRHQIWECQGTTPTTIDLGSGENVCETVSIMEQSGSVDAITCLGSSKTYDVCGKTKFYSDLKYYTMARRFGQKLSLNCDGAPCEAECNQIVEAQKFLEQRATSEISAEELQCGEKSLECLRMMSSTEVTGKSLCAIYENFENFGRYKTIQCYVDNKECHKFESFKARMYHLLNAPCAEPEKCSDICKVHDELVEKTTMILDAPCETKINACLEKSDSAKFDQLTSASRSRCVKENAFVETDRKRTIDCLYSPEVFETCRLSPRFQDITQDMVSDGSRMDFKSAIQICKSSSDCFENCVNYTRFASRVYIESFSNKQLASSVMAEFRESYTPECRDEVLKCATGTRESVEYGENVCENVDLMTESGGLNTITCLARTAKDKCISTEFYKDLKYYTMVRRFGQTLNLDCEGEPCKAECENIKALQLELANLANGDKSETEDNGKSGAPVKSLFLPVAATLIYGFAVLM